MPSFDIRSVSLGEVTDLFDRFHPYKSTGKFCTYAFAVIEDERPVAAFLWQPSPPASVKSVASQIPQGVLSLSRMVAVPNGRREGEVAQRRLKHISKPLKYQMKHLIDRTRWPVLVTYSDESVGHNGYTYQCSGWTPTVKKKARTYTIDGRRVSRYQNGVSGAPEGGIPGWALIQRWEHWITGGPEDQAPALELFAMHWDKVPITGKTWRSGAQAYTYERKAA